MALVYILGGITAAVAIGVALALALSGKDSPAPSAHVELRPVSVSDVPVGPPRPHASDRPGDNPAALAETVATIVERRATSEIDQLACTSEAASELRRELANVPAGSTATVDEALETMSQAQAKITLTSNGHERTITLEMKYVGSQWCASGI